MSGIFLFFVLAVWIFASYRLAKFISSLMMEGRKGWVVCAVLFFGLLPLPVADEIVGGIKLAQLCNDMAVITLDTDHTQGRTVWYGDSQRTQLKLGTLGVSQLKINFVDAKTQEPVFHYYRFDVKGGWLIRTMRISEGDSPILLRNYCQPKNLGTIYQELGLTHVNRPIGK